MHFRLVVNPLTDKQFVSDVEKAATAHQKHPGELEHALRPSYPSVKVQNGVTEQDGRKRWYVYRDGRWIAA